MKKPIPDFLKLHIEAEPEAELGTPGCPPALTPLCTAFELATGWRLRVSLTAELRPTFTLTSPVPSPATDLQAVPNGYVPAAIPREHAERLADATMTLVTELYGFREAVRKREAELATGVPVRRRDDETAHLALRLESILKGGAEAVQCEAAALYLLDDATSELKLRACWGLSQAKLLEPARPLRGAIADLEALLGHAVVIEDAALLQHWKIPEPCAAAACVPVSSPTEPLGTLWVFSQEQRDFTSQQTNLLEIIAGRIASELQREVLLEECTKARAASRESADDQPLF